MWCINDHRIETMDVLPYLTERWLSLRQNPFLDFMFYCEIRNPNFKIQILILQSKTPYTIHLRRPWTRDFFLSASRTVGFSLRFKNSDHFITFLWLIAYAILSNSFFPRNERIAHAISILETAEPQRCSHVIRIFQKQTETNGP